MLVLDNSDGPEYEPALGFVEDQRWLWNHLYGTVPYLRDWTRKSVATSHSFEFGKTSATCFENDSVNID